MVFNTCFVGRIRTAGGDGRQLRSYICCRFDPVSGWKSPPAENLLAFCFPLGVENVRPREYMRPEEFSFTLTAGDGSRLHGFCRRTLPPHKAPPKALAPAAAKMAMMRYPQVLCIVSPHPWFPFFYKVLELVEKMLRQEDLGAAGPSGEWPPASPAAMFLCELLQQVPAQSTLGTIVRVRLPQTELPLDFSPPRRAVTSGAGQSPLLRADAGAVELEVPPNLGLGADNAGIAAARLLFHLPPRVTLTLIASLLLERRIILVASAEDKVSAAVHAAAALLHPFRWQHIYLPLLPMSLKDYLAAPMPYLVGLNSDCLPMLRTMPLEEVLLVDLDLGECSPPPDSARDDAFLLPYASKLLSALETCKDGTLSATEFNSTPFIANVMQEYFLKLGMGRYRQFMQPDVTGTGQRRPVGGPKNGGAADTMIRAHGYAFDLAAFVEQHKNAAVREFLQQFRHSQMFEVFITERLRLAEKGETPQDGFEEKISQFMSRQASMFGSSSMVLGQHGGGSSSGGGSKFAAMLKKTANAMRQSSDNLMKGLKSLGPSQQEEYVSMPTRANTSFSLQRVSPVAGLHAGHGSRTPSLTQGSRVPSFSDIRAGDLSRPNLSRPSLGRPSPLPRGKAGAVSLEDVKPDVFFGDVDDTDAVSEMSEGSSHPRSGNSSPGPLEQGAFRNKTFSALFRLGGTSQSAAPSPRHVPSLAEQIGGGKSSSSPSLVSLDVKAGGAPQLVDLLSEGAAQSATLQPPPQPPAPAPVAGRLPQVPAAPVRPHPLLGPSGGSGCFGSPVGPPPPRRLTNLCNSSGGSPMGQDSPQAQGSSSCGFPPPVPLPSRDLTSAILGALSSHPAAPSRLARHSTGSGGNELTSLTSFFGAAEPQPMVPTMPQQQQQQQLAPQPAPQQPRARFRGGSLTLPLSMDSQGGDALPSPGPLSSRMAVKADPFGGLLVGAVTAVSEDLAVRKRTSSAGSGGGSGLPAQEGSGSWADFSAAAVAAAPAAGGAAGSGGGWTVEWPAQGAQPAGAASGKGGQEVTGLSAQFAAGCTVAGAGAGPPGAQVNAAVQRKRTSTTDEWGAFM